MDTSAHHISQDQVLERLYKSLPNESDYIQWLTPVLENHPHLVNSKCNKRISVLMRAISFGYSELTQLLLDKGAYIYASNAYKDTVVDYIMQAPGENVATKTILERALKRGFISLEKTSQILLLAAQKDWLDTAALMLKHGGGGCNLIDGMSPVMDAANSLDMYTLESLARLGADFTLTDDEGRNALHHLMDTDHGKGDDGNDPIFETAQMLIAQGCPAMPENARGQTPRDMAIEREFDLLADMLLTHEQHARLDQTTPDGQKARHKARL